MSNLLDELERLGGMALMRPWAAQRSASGYHAATSASGIGVFSGADKPDADYAVAAVNALPALLRVARAAQALRAADEAWEAYIRDDGPDDDARAEALDDMASEAKAQMTAALAALESEANQ